MTDSLWEGWWVVRWRQRLVHIEADDAADAVQGSIDALRGMGDWPQAPAELSAHACVEHQAHSRRRDFTRAVIDRHRRGGSTRKGARQRRHLKPVPPPPAPRLTAPRHEHKIDPWSRSPRHGCEVPQSGPSHPATASPRVS